MKGPDRGRPHGRARHGRPPNHFSRPPQPPRIPPGAGTGGSSSCMVLVLGALGALGALTYAAAEAARWLT